MKRALVNRIIGHGIFTGRLPQGYELKDSDVGKPLGYSFGLVLKNDVGKKVWVKPYGLVMENNAQRDKRKGRKNPRKRRYGKSRKHARRARRNCGCKRTRRSRR